MAREVFKHSAARISSSFKQVTTKNHPSDYGRACIFSDVGNYKKPTIGCQKWVRPRWHRSWIVDRALAVAGMNKARITKAQFILLKTTCYKT
jgi:hypothetical protein